MVHNDVELHWSSFIAASRILAVTLTGATHFVDDSGTRLTNRRSAERLELFRTFENGLDRILAQPDAGRIIYLLPFVRFVWKLTCWVGRNIDEEHHAELVLRAQRFFLRRLDLPLMTLVAYADPQLAHRINTLVMRGTLT